MSWRSDGSSGRPWRRDTSCWIRMPKLPVCRLLLAVSSGQLVVHMSCRPPKSWQKCPATLRSSISRAAPQLRHTPVQLCRGELCKLEVRAEELGPVAVAEAEGLWASELRTGARVRAGAEHCQDARTLANSSEGWGSASGLCSAGAAGWFPILECCPTAALYYPTAAWL